MTNNLTTNTTTIVRNYKGYTCMFHFFRPQSGMTHIRCYGVLKNNDQENYCVRLRMYGRPSFTTEFVNALPKVDEALAQLAIARTQEKFAFETNSLKYNLAGDFLNSLRPISELQERMQDKDVLSKEEGKTFLANLKKSLK